MPNPVRNVISWFEHQAFGVMTIQVRHARAVRPQAPDVVGEPQVVSHHHPALAERDRLPRVKAEARDVAVRPDGATFI